MSIKTDNYIRFFQDQVTEIQREYNKTKAVPMKQLFRDEIITLATIDSVNHTNGHVVIKVKKGFAPRLKVMKNITLVTKHAKDVLGTIANWNLSFDEFNRTSSFHVGLSDIVPLYFIKKADVEYDYIGCSYVSLSLFSNIDNALRSGKTVTALLFDPFPPTEYFNNLAFYTKQNEADIYLDIEPKISYDEWTPEELAYDENNPYGIVDKIYNTLSEESCCIVQGPPGTGKSFTIAHIISRYLEQGKCVCVTTMANKGLIELAKQPPLAKYLETSKVYKTRLAADEAKQVPGLQPASKDLCVPAGSVVLATNYILSGLFNSNRDPSLLHPSYDLIVIEEASQVFLSAIAAFKSIGKHCLIVGDPMQLPPIVLGADKIQYKLWKVQQQCDGLSSFALGTDIKSYRITTTFRLTPRSASQTALFYGESFRSVQKERLDFGEIQSPYFPKEGGCILAYSQSGTDSVCSKGALSIMHYVVDQISHFYPEREVAIITPFKDTIKLLQKEFYTENQQLDITVETIDRIQGMTVDYAIVYFPMCNISFALSENRFNVATSRSRSTTLIISDLDFKALSSVPRKSLRFLDTCEMYGADSVKPVGKPIASETPKSQTESATVISSGDMSVKVFEVNPKVWTKNFGVYFMLKKHDYSALLKYMHMLEDGYSINYIHTNYGINEARLSKLWFLYQKEGRKVLHRQSYTHSNATFRHKVVLDIENNGVSLVQASIKYGVSAGQLYAWLKTYRQGGVEALSITRKRGRPPGMGRPKKVQKPETELERLRRENQELKTEVALLKKVKALVEEREARLRAIGRGQSEN